MAVYYKFKSARDYDSVPIDGHFISVLNLKEKIFESKHLGRGTDFDLVVTNAQTNEEYVDEDMLIPKNTSVLIRRIPRRTGMPIVTQPNMPKKEDMSEDVKLENTSFLGSESFVAKHSEDIEWDEFGNDLYEIPEVVPALLSNPICDASPPSKADEDNKIRDLVDTPALDWQCQASDVFGGGNRGFGRGVGGRMMGGRGFGRGGGFERGFDRGFERRTPPQGYICFRCNVPGHFIHHCPTNGDPNFDIKRAKPPTGIPKSMLMATPDGSYALPSGAVAVMRPNEAAFEKEIEGLPSSRCVGDLPPELHCPLCKEVMKDAVLTSKCCFNSFCDKCIRDHIISKSVCVCGAANVLADDLLPNKTLRDTINRILESNNSSAENAGSAFQIQDMESARRPPPRASSPNMSAASMGERHPVLPQNEEISAIKENGSLTPSPPQQNSSKENITKAVDVLEATPDSINVKEEVSHHSVLPEEESRPMDSAEAGKKKKKKSCLPLNSVDMNWKTPPDFPPENLMMPSGPCGYNPYWNGMQPGMDGGYMGNNPNFYGAPMPYPNFFPQFDVPFNGIIPPDHFNQQPYILPQRDVLGYEMGTNVGPPPPAMSREEFEARKADLRRKREMERCEFERGDMKDREMTSRNGPIPTMKSKSYRSAVPSTNTDRRHENHRTTDRRRESHRRSESLSAAAAEAERNHKASVFSRISFPEKDKKRISSSSAEAPPPKKICSTDCESSDDDRHFKRKASTYGREEGRYSRKRERSHGGREEVRKSKRR